MQCNVTVVRCYRPGVSRGLDKTTSRDLLQPKSLHDFIYLSLLVL